MAEKYGSIIYCANIKKFKALSNTKKANKIQLLSLIKKANDWEMNMYSWDENLNLAIQKYIIELLKEPEIEAFEQIWADYYRYDPVSYVRNMVKMGFGGSIRKDNGTEVYVIFDPTLIEVIEIKKLKESKIMCKSKKSCGCGCSIKKNINESIDIQNISDDILSIKSADNTGSELNIDIEKYEYDEFSLVINDDHKNTQHFNNFNELVQYIGNSENKNLKNVFFNVKVMDKIMNFGYSDNINEAEQEMYDHPQTPKLEEGRFEVNYYKKYADRLNKRGQEIMLAKATASEKGLLKDGEIMYESKEISKILNLFKKYYKLNSKFNSENNEKFMGFNTKEATKFKDANNMKVAAWDLARKFNLDTNEILDLDSQAKKSVIKESVSGSDLDLWNKLKNDEEENLQDIFNELKTRAEKKSGKPVINLQDIQINLGISDYKIIEEGKKINLKINSNTKRELIKNAKTALDAIYYIYNIIEKQSIENTSFSKDLDKAFEGTNAMLTNLVIQNSIDSQTKNNK